MRTKAAHICPLLCLIVYGLLLACRIPALSEAVSGGNYLTQIILQLLIFVIPATVYLRARGTGGAMKLNLKPFGPAAVGITILTLLTMIAGSWLIRMGQLTLMLGDTSISFTGFTGTSPESLKEGLYLTLSLAVAPAVCEEFFFRSLLFTEYTEGGFGAFTAGGLNALLFAMMHFDLLQFPIYLWTGVLLVMLTYITESVYPAMICHFGYNLYGLFGEGYLLRYLENPQNTIFLLFLIAVVFLILLVLLLSEAERVFTAYGSCDRQTPAYATARLKAYPKARDRVALSARAWLSPLFLFCVIIFFMMTVAAK